MSRFAPTKAVRQGQKARVALAGPSGSGKTWTALTLAQGLGGSVLVIDSERGSSRLYADDFVFDVIEWVPPFDPRELAQVIAEQATEYDVIVLDSLSHYWEGEGGTRDIVDNAVARSRTNNSFIGWKEGTPAQDRMVQAIITAPCHVIATMRAKTEYVLETDTRGKQVPRKVGMAPIQRPGIDYEFTLTAEIDQAHNVMVDKSRCRSLADRVFKAGDAGVLGSELAAWLDEAEPAEERITAAQAETLVDAMNLIPDANRRRQVKDEFVKTFGTPQLIALGRYEEAEKWVDEHAADPPDPQPPVEPEPPSGELSDRAEKMRERVGAGAPADVKQKAAGS